MVPAVHCEARKIAYRQTKDGLVVSFVIHPNDLPDALAIAPLGQRYMLALAAIGDDETAQPQTAHPLTGRVDEGSGRGTPTSSPNNNARTRYHSQTDMEKARDRAGMLPNDTQFRKWVGVWRYGNSPAAMVSKDDAEQFVRDECAVKSRSEIATDIDAYDAFVRLETEYKIATGQIAEQRR